LSIKLLFNTFPQTGHLPESCPLLARSCMDAVTRPWDPSKCRSKPWKRFK